MSVLYPVSETVFCLTGKLRMGGVNGLPNTTAVLKNTVARNYAEGPQRYELQCSIMQLSSEAQHAPNPGCAPEPQYYPEHNTAQHYYYVRYRQDGPVWTPAATYSPRQNDIPYRESCPPEEQYAPEGDTTHELQFDSVQRFNYTRSRRGGPIYAPDTQGLNLGSAMLSAITRTLYVKRRAESPIWIPVAVQTQEARPPYAASIGAGAAPT